MNKPEHTPEDWEAKYYKLMDEFDKNVTTLGHYLLYPHPKELQHRIEELKKQNHDYEVAQKGNLAKLDELNYAIALVWKALGITVYTGKHISEHVTSLREENARLRKADELVAAIERQGSESYMPSTVWYDKLMGSSKCQ